MPVRIRLMRMGSKRRPFYRFVVTDSRNKRDGAFLDQVGYYNPIVKPFEVKVDEAKIFDWLSKGAEITDGARSLLKKVGVLARWEAMRASKGEPQAKSEEVEASQEQQESE